MASALSRANARGMLSRSVRTSPTVTGLAAAPRARLQPIKLNVRYANVVNTVRSWRDAGRVSVDSELGDPGVGDGKPLDPVRVSELPINDEPRGQETGRPFDAVFHDEAAVENRGRFRGRRGVGFRPAQRLVVELDGALHKGVVVEYWIGQLNVRVASVVGRRCFILLLQRGTGGGLPRPEVVRVPVSAGVVAIAVGVLAVPDLQAEIGLVVDAIAPVEPQVIPPSAAQRVHFGRIHAAQSGSVRAQENAVACRLKQVDRLAVFLHVIGPDADERLGEGKSLDVSRRDLRERHGQVGRRPLNEQRSNRVTAAQGREQTVQLRDWVLGEGLDDLVMKKI